MSQVDAIYSGVGWVVLPDVLNKASTYRLRNMCASMATPTVIFNQSACVDGDNDKRRRMSMPLKDHLLSDAITRRLQACGLWCSKCHDISEVVVVRSDAGCREQWPHTDYNIRRSARPAPLVVLLAIEEDTRMIVSGHGDQVHEVTVPVGGMLVLHGGVVHAGAAYTRSNTRIHMYIGAPASYEGVRATYPLHTLGTRLASGWHKRHSS